MAEELHLEPINDTLRRARVASYAGVVLFVLGLVVLYLGYSGSSKNPIVEAQIPYLISGGLFGAALMICGGIAYAASVVLGVLGASPASSAAPSISLVTAPLTETQPTPATGNGKSKGHVFVAGGGTSFHTKDCRLVERAAEVREVSRDQATSEGMQPCRVCTPQQA